MRNLTNGTSTQPRVLDAQLSVARALGHKAGSIDQDEKYDSGQFTDVFCESLATLTDEEAKITYLSTPVTGGAKKYEFLLEKGVESRNQLGDEELSEFSKKVILGNIQGASELAEQMRQDGTLVLNPAGLGNMPRWTQGDYMRLWTDTINKHIDKLVVRDGWQFSMGCAMEVKQALNLGIPVSDQQGKTIDNERAIELAKSAEERVASWGFDVTHFNTDEVLADPHFEPADYLKEL